MTLTRLSVLRNKVCKWCEGLQRRVRVQQMTVSPKARNARLVLPFRAQHRWQHAKPRTQGFEYRRDAARKVWIGQEGYMLKSCLAASCSWRGLEIVASMTGFTGGLTGQKKANRIWISSGIQYEIGMIGFFYLWEGQTSPYKQARLGKSEPERGYRIKDSQIEFILWDCINDHKTLRTKSSEDNDYLKGYCILRCNCPANKRPLKS